MTTEATPFELFLAEPPKLHSWDFGKTWNDGGIAPETLSEIFKLCTTHVVKTAIETGSGNSTLCFVLAGVQEVISIDPDQELLRRVRAYCQGHGIDCSAINSILKTSDIVLPKLAEDWSEKGKMADLALIDGDHGWPSVFVDFCYLYKVLRVGGFLIVDDVQLHSVKELARLLTKSCEFKLVKDLRKTLIFQKVWETFTMSGFTGQVYLRDRTAADETSGQAFQLF